MANDEVPRLSPVSETVQSYLLDGDLMESVLSSLGRSNQRRARTTGTIKTIHLVPTARAKVQPEAYRVREVPLSLLARFEDRYPLANLKGDHATFHVLSILGRTQGRAFDDFVTAVKEIEEEIRACHATEIPRDDSLFTNAVFSGCHVVDNMIRFLDNRICPDCPPYLWVDYLLVENQIPFCILQKIYDKATPDNTQNIRIIRNLRRRPPLVDLCLEFFIQFLEFNLERLRLQPTPVNVHHLLHLVHHYLLPSTLPQTNGGMRMKPVPSARRLQLAGIKFKKKNGPGIIFRRGILHIPYLRVDVNTKPFLLNMAAWERVHPDAGSYFTSYVIFMDYLINTKEDVEILNDSGVIEQSLGSEEEAATIFNGLSWNIVYNGSDNNFLPHLSEDLNRFCDKKYNIWWASLVADYLSNPWVIISLIVGIYLLIVTSLQTVYTIYPYYRPRS